MQNTLLGLAIAVILALVAALVGPLFVDWGQHRAAFEAQATRVVGMPVRVGGPIVVRLLPTPTLVLSNIEIGRSGETNTVRARKLAFELSLGALMRGQFRVSETNLIGPQFAVALDGTGRVNWPALTVGFEPEAVAIEHLKIDDGRVVLSEAASGARVVLDKLWFTGAVSSLAGPFKGEGAFICAGEAYGYRVATGRVQEDGALHIHVGLDPSDRLTMDADGTLSWEGGMPRFEGALSVSRPASLARGSGETLLSEPWRTKAKVQATPAALLLEQAELQYGSEERGLKLSGTARLTLGEKPRFEGVFSGRQIDLDRAIARPDVTAQAPVAALRTMAAAFAGRLHAPFPLQIGLSIDALTLSGSTLQGLRADVAVEGDRFDFSQLEFRAPGFTQVQANGRLDLTPAGIGGFAGLVSIDAGDPRAFAAWLEGRDPGPSKVQNLRARGEVVLAQDKLQVERMRLELEHQTLEGRLAYLFAAGDRPARVEVDLQAPELDIDQALAFAQAAIAGTKLEVPKEITLALAVGHATIAGIDLRQAETRLHIDGNSIQVDRLSVADLGGAAIQASGGIDGVADRPHGRMSLDLDARDLAGVTAVLAKFAPQAAEPIRRLGDRLLPAKLHAALSVEAAPSGPGTLAKLGLDGRAGVFRFSLQGEESGELLPASSNAQVRLDGKIETDDGSALARLTGADRFIAVDTRPAKLTFAGKGALNGELRLDTRVVAAGLDATAGGTVRLTGAAAPAAALKITVANADARPLRRQASGKPEALPLALSGQLTVTPDTARFDDISGKIAGAAVRGHLAAALGHPTRIDGTIETDAIDASAAIAAAIGLPTQGGVRSELAVWSAEPFAPWLYGDLAGQVEIKAARATFTPTLVARQARAVLHLTGSEVAIDDITGMVAGGRLTAQLTVRSTATGLAASARLGLRDADAAGLIPGTGRSPVTGRFALQVEAAGEGLSPGALIGSITGGGVVSFERAQFAGFNPRVFATITRAVDQGTMLDAPRVHDIVATAFDAGRLSVPRLEAAIAINAGHARAGTTIVPAEGAELAVSGNLDLGRGELDERLTVSGPAGPDASGQRPDVTVSLKGPLVAPKRSLDVSALAGWLTMRAVDLQARKLEAAEAKRREVEAAEAKRREVDAAAETKRREAEAAEAKRRESALNPDQAASDRPASSEAIGEDARRVPAPDAGKASPRASTGTAGAHENDPPQGGAGKDSSLGTVAPPRAGAAPGLEPLPPPIEVRPAPVLRKPLPSHAGGLNSLAAPRSAPATPPPPKKPAPAPPLRLFNPSANP